MLRNTGYWDEMEETGLRLCPEDPANINMSTMVVSACCWDPTNPGTIGLCDSNGSFAIAPTNSQAPEEQSPRSTSSRSYAVYFSTLPVHLWDRGRRRGDGATGQDSHASLATPARRVGHAWSQVAFVPGQEGEVVFVQGWSPRVLLTKLPQGGAGGARNMDSSRQLSMSSSSSIGFLDGSRVAALNGHESQVQCLAIDGEGRLLVTGDENGVICARLLHQADGRVANGHHASCPRDREGASLGSDGDGTTVASAAAHEGGVFAVSHVRRDTRVGVKGGRGITQRGYDENGMLFVSGGAAGDVVRLWMATYEDVQHGTGSAARLSLNILTEMHVGGCQVSSLATGPSYRTPLVMVGCAEGTVFGFALEPPPPDGSLACGTKNKIQLGRLLMKLQHTRQRVTSVTCSREEELIATADAEGIVRTYRPLVTGDKAGDAAFVGADGLPSRQFELVVECRLGSAAALCEFAIEQVETIAPRDGGRDGDSTEGVAAAAVKQARREEQEVLRTCTKHGARVRVWPAAALPKTPLRPLPLQLPSSPPPPPLHPNRHQDTRIPIPPGYTADDTNPPPRNFENEEKQQGSSETRPSVAHGGSEEHVDDKEEARGRGEEREEGPNPSATAPIPGQRPATPRRVSFANAEQVYKYSTPNREDDTESFSMDNWGQDTGQHDNNQREDEEDDEQDPRPPPPAPTPRPSGPSHPRKLKQHWGSSALGRGNHVPMDAARESKEDVFVRPSSLQEPSLWSTAMEQQALELKMKEEFDSFATRQHLEQQTFRGAAASAVNVHPLARTFEGLVPVSLDAPPPRPKRKGKQVSKAHLSKVEQERITEEQLLFDGMEPDRSSIASNMGSSHMVLQDMEWYGARPAYNQQEDNCFVADRVWSWGVRP